MNTIFKQIIEVTDIVTHIFFTTRSVIFFVSCFDDYSHPCTQSSAIIIQDGAVFHWQILIIASIGACLINKSSALVSNENDFTRYLLFRGCLDTTGCGLLNWKKIFSITYVSNGVITNVDINLLAKLCMKGKFIQVLYRKN